MYQIVLLTNNREHRVVIPNIALDKAIEQTKKLNQEHENNYLTDLISKVGHMKNCPDPKHIQELDNIMQTKDFRFYYRKNKSPMYILLIKFLNDKQLIDMQKDLFNGRRKGIGRVNQEKYIEQERFYNLEDLNKKLASYEPFIDKGIFLLKVMTISHPFERRIY